MEIVEKNKVLQVLRMDFLQSFCVEVIELIFSHLTHDGILESTLIAPKANRIISNSVELMRNCRVHIRNSQIKRSRKVKLPTRKYSRLDYYHWYLPQRLKNPPVLLTQLVFDGCSIDVENLQELFFKIRNTLELLVIGSSNLYIYGRIFSMLDYEVDDLLLKMQLLQFPKLKTFMMVNLLNPEYFTLLSMIKTSNLSELGMIQLLGRPPTSLLTKDVSRMFVNLIKSNPEIKVLHVPAMATKIFLEDALAHPKIKFQLEELCLAFDVLTEWNLLSSDNAEMLLNFLGTLENPLKCLRLVGCFLEDEHVRSLLLLSLERLELYFCSFRWPQDIILENTTIQSISFISFGAQTDQKVIRRILKFCKNLAAVVILLPPGHSEGSENLPNFIDIEERLPKYFTIKDLRSPRYAGLALLIAFLREKAIDASERLFYHKKLKELSVEQHPFSIVEFEEPPAPGTETLGPKFYY